MIIDSFGRGLRTGVYFRWRDGYCSGDGEGGCGEGHGCSGSGNGTGDESGICQCNFIIEYSIGTGDGKGNSLNNN